MINWLFIVLFSHRTYTRRLSKSHQEHTVYGWESRIDTHPNLALILSAQHGQTQRASEIARLSVVKFPFSVLCQGIVLLPAGGIAAGMFSTDRQAHQPFHPDRKRTDHRSQATESNFPARRNKVRHSSHFSRDLLADSRSLSLCRGPVDESL